MIAPNTVKQRPPLDKGGGNPSTAIAVPLPLTREAAIPPPFGHLPFTREALIPPPFGHLPLTREALIPPALRATSLSQGRHFSFPSDFLAVRLAAQEDPYHLQGCVEGVSPSTINPQEGLCPFEGRIPPLPAADEGGRRPNEAQNSASGSAAGRQCRIVRFAYGASYINFWP